MRGMHVFLGGGCAVLGCECCRWRQGGVFLCAGCGGRSVFFYAQDAAAEVAEWARVAAVRFLGRAMVGRLWGVWREVELERHFFGVLRSALL